MERGRRNHSPVLPPAPGRQPPRRIPYRLRPVARRHRRLRHRLADPQNLPRDRAYGQVAAQLGRQRVRELLIGALEIDELAVRPHARGHGTGRALLAEITADAPDARAWLLTARVATDTVATYRRLGWHEITPLPGTENGVVVFLAPNHPSA